MKEARSAAEAAGDEWERLDGELSRYDAQVDRLEKLKRTLARYEARDSSTRHGTICRRRRTRRKSLDDLEAGIATVKAELKTAEGGLELARTERKHRRDDANKLEAVRDGGQECGA